MTRILILTKILIMTRILILTKILAVFLVPSLVELLSESFVTLITLKLTNWFSFIMRLHMPLKITILFNVGTHLAYLGLVRIRFGH
jgi:hypothetical protein